MTPMCSVRAWVPNSQASSIPTNRVSSLVSISIIRRFGKEPRQPITKYYSNRINFVSFYLHKFIKSPQSKQVTRRATRGSVTATAGPGTGGTTGRLATTSSTGTTRPVSPSRAWKWTPTGCGWTKVATRSIITSARRTIVGFSYS